ncbi:VanZ family protein [Zongyangia hominis]|uniref:VanZ family protein n=1 Tax=Zongyangia hominis TaxID=2763677 RepID=A0A926EGF2_9FIRM|nr:VanZ family protein [Zongyangia hominis]MBC8571361.1 VanZ family protein [Zongyangia hominis]
MKTAVYRVCALVCYLLSGAAFACFVYGSLALSLSPIGKVGVLCVGCLCFYLGSLALGRTLLPPWPRRLAVFSLALFFILYLWLLLSFTLFDVFFGRSALRPIGWSGEAFTRYLQTSLNLLPFRTIGEFVLAIFTGDLPPRVILTNLLGNLCAMMPFAFFLPALFPRLRSWRRFIPAMVLIVAGIELSQFLLLTGSCDIDDIILNAGGACLLFALLQWAPVKRWVQKLTLEDAPALPARRDRP